MPGGDDGGSRRIVTSPTTPSAADGAKLVRHELSIQKSRAVFYNGAWLVGLVAKLLGLLDFSWAAAVGFLVLANLNIVVFAVLYSRGVARFAGVPLRVYWMGFDLAIISWAIALSGGSRSPLYPWYLTNAASAAFFSGRRGLLAVMAADTAAYLGLVAILEGPELTTLTWVFGKMLILFGAAGYALFAISQLQDKRRVISELRAVETRRAGELESAIGTITSSASRLAGAADALSMVSRSMSANAEDTALQAGSVSMAVGRVSDHVQTVAAAVEELSYGVREIAVLARDAAQAASDAVEVADDAGATIGRLAESGAEITGIIGTITSIADQTRLLALNATIEAARAGEAGRGFAVVADEVKALAAQTAVATEEIGPKITAIRAHADAVVGAINRIGGFIARVNELQATIAGAVEQQTATTAEISSSIADAARGGSEIAESIGAVATAAGETSSGAAAVEQAARDLTRMAEELRSSQSPGRPV
jgi:methyl-accepting chemotaxis protein